MRFAFDGMVIDAPPARNIRPVPYDPVKDFVPVSVVAGITWSRRACSRVSITS